MGPLAEAYANRWWSDFGSIFAELWSQADQAEKLSLLRDLLCCFRDTRAQAAVLTKCDLR